MQSRPDSIIAPAEPCPYLAGRTMQLECFSAGRVAGDELASLLAAGWRTFGPIYFRPACPDCRACTPLRIPVATFKPSKSQRRIWRRNRGTRFSIGPLRYSDEIYGIYHDHSWTRFGRHTDPDEFRGSLYQPSCPSLQTEYRVDGALAAVGFVSVASNAFSSVYFAFRDRYKRYGLGVLSVMAECACTAAAGLRYYYLGYWIRQSAHMRYKSQFGPHEFYDWLRAEWRPGDKA
jgi:arginyl-tRNA--protein-N-Asp/Glu arginylyltransferase